jgi:predicted deacylase
MDHWKFDLVPAPAPGGKTRGLVDWGDPVVTGHDWPYVAVRGERPGPAVLVTAGIHGSEYPSIDAAMQLGATLDPAEVSGQVLCLPLLNPAAFWERAAYVSPPDQLNLNRTFPGKPKGSFTERLAWLLVQRAMRHADAYLDMHGGDLPEALVPFALYQKTGDAAVDARSEAMAHAFGSTALLAQPSTGGQLAGLAYATAASLGIPAIIAEDGGAGEYAPEIAAKMLEGARNVLRSAGVLDGPVRNTPPPRRFGSFVWVRAEQAGFFKPSVRVGDEVAQGVALGTIGDFFGQVVETVVAAASGQLLFLVVSPAVSRGGLICGIGASAG